MDLTQFAMSATMLIGLVNIANMAIERNWKSFAKAMIACVAGVVLGFLHWFGVPSPEIGLALAIASSGVYKTAQVL